MSCVFCHSENGRVQYPLTDIFNRTRNMVRCDDCHSFYLSPHPSDTELAEAYDDSYFGKQEKKFREPFESVIQWFRQGRARRMNKMLRGKGKVLDIGCGNGQFLNSLSALGDYELWGNETGAKAIERARKVPGISLLEGDILDHEPEANSFDAISLYHVFEHLPQPALILDAIAGLSKPGGIVEISIPNITSFQAKVFKGKWLHHDPPRHLFHITPDRLKTEMVKRGYTHHSSKYFSAEQNPFGWVQSYMNRITSKRDVLFERMKGNSSYAPNYGSLAMFIFKLFFFMGMPHYMVFDLFESLLGRSATVRMTFRKTRA